jgi:hypothetical protein
MGTHEILCLAPLNLLGLLSYKPCDFFELLAGFWANRRIGGVAYRNQSRKLFFNCWPHFATSVTTSGVSTTTKLHGWALHPKGAQGTLADNKFPCKRRKALAKSLKQPEGLRKGLKRYPFDAEGGKRYKRKARSGHS